MSIFTDTLYKLDTTGKVRTFQIEIEEDKYRMITGTKDGKKVESKWTVCEPKNVGKANATTAEQQAVAEAEARITKKLSQHYYKTEKECLDHPEQFFTVMLALEKDKIKGGLQFPLILDPKLDGMRMVATLYNHYSRKGKDIPAAQFIAEELEPFFEEYPNIILDGEIYSHDLSTDFNKLMSIARKQDLDAEHLEDAKNILQYHVYDLYDINNPKMNATDRKMFLDEILPVSTRIRKVPWVAVQNEDELKLINQMHVTQGYEGSIARTPWGVYEGKRSKNLIKIKQFITEEFLISDIVEGIGNRSGLAGTVEVIVGTTKVGCGIRGDFKYYKHLLDNKADYIGKFATVRHFGFTPDGSLRFPVCIDVDRPD